MSLQTASCHKSELAQKHRCKVYAVTKNNDDTGKVIPMSCFCYCISSVIRQSLHSFQNNPKNLDPSGKMDLDLWDCLGRVKLVL